MAVINLSRKGWNNVIIVAMLAMIFVFNGLHHKVNDEPQAQGAQPLLPAQSYILTLSYPGLTIERIGTSWRSQGDIQGSPERVINAWLNAQADLTQAVQEAPLLSATIEVAGDPMAWVFLLYENDQHYHLYDKRNQRWFELDNTQAQQLFVQLNNE